MKKKKPSQLYLSPSLEDMKMDVGQTSSLGRGRNNRDRNSVTFDRFVYTSNKSYQRLDGDDVVDVDAAEGAGGGGGNVTKSSSASSRRASSNKSKNFQQSNHLRALDNKQQQSVIVENKPKNVKFASTIDSKQPKQKQPMVKGETKTIRKDEDSEAEDDVEVEVVIEEVSVRVPAKINDHERQTNKRNLLTTMQQLRRMRLLKQHHHPLIDDDDSDDDIVCEEEEEGVQSDDDSLLGAKCETTDVLSYKVSKVMSNQRGAFSGVTFGNVKVGMGCHEVSDDDETMITTRTESPLSHEGGEELDDTLILEDVIVDIAESFRRFAMCEDLFNCEPQQQQKIKRRKVMVTIHDKKQQQHKNETSYCTCNEVLL